MPMKKANADESLRGKDEVAGSFFWTPPAGDNGKFRTTRIRILPPHEDNPDNKFYSWAAVHGSLPGVKRAVRCPAKMDDGVCPACDFGNEQWQANKKEVARKFFSSWKALVNIIVLDADGNAPEGAQVKVWSIAKGTAEELLNLIEELPKAERDITDVAYGRDVFIRRKGAGPEDTKYEIRLAEGASPLADETIEMADKELFLLTNVYKRDDAEKIEGYMTAGARPKMLAPVTSDPFADDDEEEVIKAEYRVMPEPEEEEDDDEEEVIVQTPPPPRSTVVKRESRAADAAERDTPFDADDDDDDDEAPAPLTTAQSEAKAKLMARLRG